MASAEFAVTFPAAPNFASQIGVVQNSTINNTFNHTIPRADPPPSPLFFVPFPRDEHFVGRGTLLEEIRERCFTRNIWTALVGLGGVG
jgi:hypothetical protein